MPKTKPSLFPSLPYEKWKDTLDTLHLWIQIVGKLKLKQNPFINQWWEVVFYLTTNGMTTGRIPYNNKVFEVNFDFVFHKLVILVNDGKEKSIALRPMSVANFYEEFMKELATLGIKIAINPFPSEIQNPIPFKNDNKHKSYEKENVAKWHQIQLQSSFIFDKFRSNFRGKSSPVHFFWGGFDLATTRFSGKKLPDKKNWPKGYSFMRYAENEENFACGFWPGDERFPYPAFYSYLYPAPKGFDTIKTGPSFSYFNKKISLCILPYEEARKTKNPDKEILDFLETTYKEYAKLAGWNIKDLEGLIPN